MGIGIPTEIKPDERRVAVTPAGARELVGGGNRVFVQRGAGTGSGFPDEAYESADADLATVEEGFERAELLLKVKEPQPEEIGRRGPLLRDEQARGSADDETRALRSATLEHALRLADLGPEAALDADPLLARGLHVSGGRIVHDVVAAAVDSVAAAA